MTGRLLSADEALARLTAGETVDPSAVSVTEPLDAVRAFHLRKAGVMVPDDLITYNDEDLAYDPDFDEEEWQEEPLHGIEEDTYVPNAGASSVVVRLQVDNPEQAVWVAENQQWLAEILAPVVTGLYQASRKG